MQTNYTKDQQMLHKYLLGKFEGETGATEYFWNLVMNGEGDAWFPDMGELDPGNDDGGGTLFDVFTVDADEANAWPDEFKIGDTVIIWECSQGFVTLCAYGTRNAAESHVTAWLSITPELAPQPTKEDTSCLA